MITHVGEKKQQWPLHWQMVWMPEKKEHLISIATGHQRPLPTRGLLQAVLFVHRS